MRVDWIRRDRSRVDAQWERALRGEHALHAQLGHPLGFLADAVSRTEALLADVEAALR